MGLGWDCVLSAMSCGERFLSVRSLLHLIGEGLMRGGGCWAGMDTWVVAVGVSAMGGSRRARVPVQLWFPR